jgi:hypothetical protein
MRLRTDFLAVALLAGASAVALWPALAQSGPESILPPGFGPTQPAESSAPKAPERPETPPVNLLPATPDNGTASPATSDTIGDLIETTGNNSETALVAPPDLPPEAQRSLDGVGLIPANESGFAADGFGTTDGRFLSALMRNITAPLASRWQSILLRRALLAQSDIPDGVNGADWVADRAWLLLRMGEADMARALVARVDAANFTPRLYDIAMQAALATGDPASVCSIADAAADVSDDAAWPLTQAMCAGLAGEPGTASALIDQVRDDRVAGGIDVLLAEKVVGAASNTRRAVTLQWDDVEKLSAWRFGVANATGVVIPTRLFATVGPQVQAWQARAPLIDPLVRAPFAERAASIGVLSSAALVDFYASIWDATDPEERDGSVGELLRTAYTGDGDAARLAAMRSLWEADKGGDAYARELMTARAAAELPVGGSVSGGDLDRLIASMMSAGLDIQAARWGNQAAGGSLAWAMLAVGAPRPLAGVNASAVQSAENGNGRGRLLLAGLAGLGRLSGDDVNALAQRYAVPLGRQTSWTRALDRAVAAREPRTVVLVAAAGMQTTDWRGVPAENLYRIVAALRQVGLEPEARMIAAEALART